MPKTVTYHRSRHLDGREVRSPYTKNHCRRWWWSMSKELEAASANAPEWRDLSGRNYAGRVKPIQPVCCPTRFYRAWVGLGKSQQCLSFLYSFMLRTANKPSLERKKKLVQSLQIQKKKKKKILLDSCIYLVLILIWVAWIWRLWTKDFSFAAQNRK